ncbi:MAG: hypothetical protein DMF75_10810 [Acidobacteria bacterium]|nr:MAG: hypothetical protein DMF75_10810 [Acidobacteriota bacterium]
MVLVLVVVLPTEVGWFETFRGASAKSCAGAMPLVDSTPAKTIKSVISRETGDCRLRRLSRADIKLNLVALFYGRDVPGNAIANLAHVARCENSVSRWL